MSDDVDHVKQNLKSRKQINEGTHANQCQEILDTQVADAWASKEKSRIFGANLMEDDNENSDLHVDWCQR